MEIGLLIVSDVLEVFDLFEVKNSEYGGLYVLRICIGWVVNGLLGCYY